MTTNESFIPVEDIAPSPVRTRRVIALGAAAIVTVAALAAVQSSGHERAQPARQAVAMSMDQKLQQLVDRGLIPRQALDPAPLTMQQKLQNLVDKGLIPSQALERAPVTLIFGPAHPLGAADVGIPCGELVYTRC